MNWRIGLHRGYILLSLKITPPVPPNNRYYPNDGIRYSGAAVALDSLLREGTMKSQVWLLQVLGKQTLAPY